MSGYKTRLQALRVADNSIEEAPAELIGFKWPSLFQHTAIENVAPTRYNRVVSRGDED
jgi:hypothetical protein